MEKNPYDTSLEWENFYSQPTENVHRDGPVNFHPLTPSYQQEKVRPRPPVKRLSKSEALEMAHALKQCIVVGTVVGFGVLGALVANQIFTTNTVSTPDQTQAAPVMNEHSKHHRFFQGQSPSSPSDSGNFFNQQGGGYGFGQDNNSAPYSGSHTS